MNLIFSTDESAPRFDPSSADVEVWRDNQGRACAYGVVAGTSQWMCVPRVGSFRFLDSRGSALVVPDAGAARVDIFDTYFRTVLPMALQLGGLEVLHASAVVSGSGVVGFCATSETGKSTLAFALQDRGFDLFADDALVFDMDGRTPAITQIPFAIRLREQSAQFFGHRSREEVRVEPPDAGTVSPGSKLAAICVLGRLDGRGSANSRSQAAGGGIVGDRVADAATTRVVAIERLSPASAFTELLAHAYCFSLRDPSRKAAMLRQYMALTQCVPVLRVNFRSGLQHLNEIADEIVRELDRVSLLEPPVTA